MNEPEVIMGEDRTGQPVAAVKLTQDDLGHLMSLIESPQWQVYRKVLIGLKNGYFDSVLPMKEPYDISKTIGIVCGINLAINQLGALISTHKAHLEKERAKSQS